MRRHRLEIPALMFGLLFTGVGTVFLVRADAAWRFDWGWVWPAATLLAAVVVLASLRPDRSVAGDAAGPDDAATSGPEPQPWDPDLG